MLGGAFSGDGNGVLPVLAAVLSGRQTRCFWIGEEPTSRHLPGVFVVDEGSYVVSSV